MPNESNQYTQIYELKSLGYEALRGELKEVASLLNELRKAKLELNGVKGQVFNISELEAINKKIKELTITQEALIGKVRNQKNEVDKSISAYAELVNKYKEADAATKELAADFGVSSVEARKAAESAAIYKRQLEEINQLRKTGGVNPTLNKNIPVQPGISVVDNSEILEKQQEELKKTGTALNEYDKQQIESANAATVWGGAQKQTSEAIKKTGEEIEDLTTPYQNLTGSLARNIIKQNEYKQTIASTGAQLKDLNANTSAADKRSTEYKNKVAALTIEQNKAKLASSELGQTINAQQKFLNAAAGTSDRLNASVGLLRNTFRQMSVEQQASPLGKQLLQDIQVLDVQLKKSDATIGNYQRNVGNYAQKAFGVIRQAAYILPGLGIAGIFNLLYEGIVLVADKIITAASGINTLKENLANLNEVQAAANKSAGEMINTLNILYGEATDASKPINDRRDAVLALKKEFPAYFKDINDEIILNGKAIEAYKALTIEILNLSRAKAAKTKLDELEAKRLDADFQKAKIEGTTAAEKARAQDKTVVSTGNVSGGGGGAILVSREDQIKIIEDRRKRTVAEVDKTIKSIAQQEKFILDYVGASNIAKVLSEEAKKEQSKKEGRADRLDREDRNTLNLLDSLLKTQIAIEETRLTELKKLHNLSFDEEREHIDNILAINEEYLKRKIAYFENQGNLNTKEKEQLASFRKELADIQLKSQQSLDTLDKKQYDERNKALQEEFEGRQEIIQEALQAERQAAQNEANKIANDPTAKELERTAAKLKEDQALKDAQIKFNKDMDTLEKELGFSSRKNAEQRKLDLEKLDIQLKNSFTNNTKALILQQIKDTSDAANKAINEIKINIAEQSRDILENDNLTNSQKAGRISNLAKDGESSILANEVAQLEIQLPFYSDLLDAGFLLEKEYSDKVIELRLKQLALTQSITEKENANLTSSELALKNAITNIKGFFNGVRSTEAEIKQAKEFSEQAIQEAVSIAADAFWKGQENKIQAAQDLAQKSLDIEEKQLLNTAQSEAEKEAIRDQFAQKAEQVEKQAAKKRQDLALKQMAIEYGLAAIKTLASLTYPANLIALAGITALYAAKYAQVKSQTFEEGGEVPKRGGKFKGKTHLQGGTKFKYEDNEYEAEVDELAIIRTKNANRFKRHRIEGTHTEIASALNRLGGGKDFKPGAIINRLEYGGNLGESLQPPIYNSSITNISNNTQNNKEVLDNIALSNRRMLELTKATNERIDRLTVYQDIRTVQSELNKNVKQNNIGRL